MPACTGGSGGGGGQAGTSAATTTVAGATIVGTGSPTAITTGSSAGPSGAALPADLVAGAVRYVNGNPGKADTSQAPVQLGWVNQDLGVPSFPEVTRAAQAAASFVNDELGGVNGRPLALRVCAVGVSIDEDVSCAQQLASAADDLPMVAIGTVVTGNEAIYGGLGAGKAIIGSSPQVNADYRAHAATWLTPGAPGLIRGIARVGVRRLGAKTVAVVYLAGQAGRALADGVAVPAVKQLGAKVAAVPVDDGDGDLTDVANEIRSADVVIALLPADRCATLASAIGTRRQPVLTLSACTTRGSGTLTMPQSWYLATAGPIPLPGASAEVDLVAALLGRAGVPLSDLTVGAVSDVLTAVRVLGSIAEPSRTVEAVAAAVHEFGGPAFAGVSSLQCGLDETFPPLCGTDMHLYQYRDGRWTDVLGGETTPTVLD